MRRRFSINSQNINYMAIEALEDGLTATISGKLNYNSKIEYSIDGVNWIKMEIDAATSPINYGEKLLFKGNYAGDGNASINFSISKKCNLKGDIKTLWYGDNARRYNTALYASYLFRNCTTIQHVDKYFLSPVELTKNCYDSLFIGCTGLTTAPELPATTLASNCYYQMFQNCTSLTTAPELPATTLADMCYSSMFSGCTNLTSAPDLPATTLAEGCYEYMFGDFFGSCTSLTVAPELPATTLERGCYKSMFYGCTSLTTAPELPATTLADNCYHSMFYGCTALTTAPELPATTLTTECYSGMFRGCSNLNYIKMLATDIPATNCLYNWVNGVASRGTFVKNSAMTSLPSGTSGIPSGWTVIDDGEESGGGNEEVITLRPYPEMSTEEGLALLDFFISKYGIPYGTKKNPLPIDEVVYASGFGYVSDAMVNLIFIESNGSIQFRNDTVWEYNCVRISNTGSCDPFMWD